MSSSNLHCGIIQFSVIEVINVIFSVKVSFSPEMIGNGLLNTNTIQGNENFKVYFNFNFIALDQEHLHL